MKLFPAGVIMDFFQVFILSLIQGITEFLPISSSGHLILLPELTDWPDQGLLMDVSVHVGTLLAVLLYFWRDTKGLTLGLFATLGIRPAKMAVRGTLYDRLFMVIVVATLPVVGFGYLIKTMDWNDPMRNATVIGITSIVFGLLLYAVDQKCDRRRGVENVGIKEGLFMGFAQAIALIPGTSRSGITMTAGRYLGMRREDAARFSMLMAIPTILAAGTLLIKDALDAGYNDTIGDALIGGTTSFIVALLAIHFLMQWLKQASMTIFVIYRVLLGAGLLYWVNG